MTQQQSHNEVAGIQYMGEPSSTQDCKDAILRLLQYGDRITRAIILSNANKHGFLLTVNVGDQVGIKSGFGSGYLGEAPREFSYILELLRVHGSEIHEFEIEKT